MPRAGIQVEPDADVQRQVLSFAGAPCGTSEPGFGDGVQLKDVVTAFKAAELLSVEFKYQPPTRHALDNKAFGPVEWICEEGGQGAILEAVRVLVNYRA